MLGVIKSFEQPLKFQFFQLLMIFSSWWSSYALTKNCFWYVASDEVLLMNLLLMMTSSLQEHLSSKPLFFRYFKLPSCWFHCSLLFLQNLIRYQNFCLWSYTLEQILAYPIDNFKYLIIIKTLKGNVKYILFQQSLLLWQNKSQCVYW